MDLVSLSPWWAGVALALVFYGVLHRVAAQQVAGRGTQSARRQAAFRMGSSHQARGDRPSRSTVRPMTRTTRIAAMSFSSPPQIGQCSRPISTTRSSSLAQLSRTGHDHRQSRPAGARTIWAQRLLGPVQVVVAFPSRP